MGPVINAADGSWAPSAYDRLSRSAADGGFILRFCWPDLVHDLDQEELCVQRVALRGAEAGVADDVAQLFFRGAIGGAGGADYVFFEHHRPNVVAAEAQAHLADLQSLRHPARL